jgi:exodeoxyribonuclease VII small subunit
VSEPYPQRPFEESLADLERVVRDLEDGQLGLDEALARYEAGVGLIKQCHALLQQAEQRVLVLTGLEADGQPILQPFKHEATARSAVSLARPRKRADEGE